MGSFWELVIEAKIFSIMREGGLIRIIERGRRFKQEVLMGLSTAQWLERVLEESEMGVKKDYYSSTREGYRSFIAQRCSNKRGRFLEIAVYAEGGRRSLILIPEEEGGRGWRRLREVLRKATLLGRKSAGYGDDIQRRQWGKETQVKSYKEALTSTETFVEPRKGAGGGEGSRGHQGYFREGDYERDMREVHCMVRDVQWQLRNLQKEVEKVLRVVGDGMGLVETGRLRDDKGKGQTMGGPSHMGPYGPKQARDPRGRWRPIFKTRNLWRPRATSVKGGEQPSSMSQRHKQAEDMPESSS
ncbi:hypothetical protein F2P56_033099 [Juglans regia]|uniref:Uncharacterized protein n=1 Tax=Juglans regia TaxID=51240 RepID=A0A833U057_JUGRE|nr:hypothetical protein F2P56_033099 [Juglans regia]